MIKDEGIRSVYQMQGVAPDGSIKNVKTNENGIMKVEIAGGEVASTEKVLVSGKLVLSTENQLLNINAKVTSILVANYSETSDVTITVGEQKIIVGANLATELPINAYANEINLVATEADTKLYYMVKGTGTEVV